MNQFMDRSLKSHLLAFKDISRNRSHNGSNDYGTEGINGKFTENDFHDEDHSRERRIKRCRDTCGRTTTNQNPKAFA